MARNKKRYRKSSNKKKLYVLTFLIAVLAITATMTVFSKGGQPFASKDNNSQTQENGNEMTESESSSNMNVNETNNTSNDNSNDEALTFLLVGVDNEEESGAERTDTIMVANLNPKTGNVRLASIMRDSYVEIPGYENNKINASFAYGGIELLKETIETNFNINVDYHATINFDGFVEVVDTVAPDGVEVNIDERMQYQDNSGNVNIDFQPGEQLLDGEEALEYVRFRGNGNNDFGRVERQQEMLNLLKDELLSVSSVTKVPQLINAVRPNLETDVSTSKMLGLGKDILLNQINNIDTLRVPIEDSYTNERYSHAGAVLEMDKETNSQELKDFLNGATNSDKQTAANNEEEKD
ncbi:LCP family protein required for cell wall assembly [Salibacterium salarium]|uniref:LCP family protein n=1 Tax=Salibacterium salarium TaxID=284579 RepID=UPI002784CD5D|nr:LCP family protein [Salibacterium salarium]MDQ0298815.1 LCP family protein required for cell wall assembly [Salibacterium salarium]